MVADRRRASPTPEELPFIRKPPFDLTRTLGLPHWKGKGMRVRRSAARASAVRIAAEAAISRHLGDLNIRSPL
jgi:hypothetical protein